MSVTRCERGANGERLHQSFASSVWREEVKDFVLQFIDHVEAIGLSDRVFAYQVLAGSAGEWVKGESTMTSLCADYSVPMRRHRVSRCRSRSASSHRLSRAVLRACQAPGCCSRDQNTSSARPVTWPTGT